MDWIQLPTATDFAVLLDKWVIGHESLVLCHLSFVLRRFPRFPTSRLILNFELSHPIRRPKSRIGETLVCASSNGRVRRRCEKVLN